MSSNAQSKKDENLGLSKFKNPVLAAMSERATRYCCKAKYYRNPDGTYSLASIQKFDTPRFKAGFELYSDQSGGGAFIEDEEDEQMFISDKVGSDEDQARARRRAQKAMADLVFGNPELDVFLTLTINPELVGDKSSWEECYKCLKNWLSNKVQRRAAVYVGVAERTKRGDVHWHFLINSGALDLVGATDARTGAALYHNHRRTYNETSWRWGFTTAQRVGGDDAHVKVSKYLMKYVTKSAEMVGGRYYMHGGKLRLPYYVYADAPEELGDLDAAVWTHKVEKDDFSFCEWSFM